ncbi:MAG: ATP-binding protein [Candidatus Omnitrophota bacterium]|nr:ATP-binding protein [Candidatus Omnitrophota bacterium]
MKEKFFDREIYLDILKKRMIALKEGYRQNIAIIGDEQVGKTAIVLKFLDKFHDSLIISVYLEILPQSSFEFARRFIGALLYAFLDSSEANLKEDLDLLISKSGRHIPKTVEKIKHILGLINTRKTNGVFAELLFLCESIYQETGKRCVVIFDEFHNLENIGFKNLYNEWSKILLTQKNTLYIIVSSMKYRAREILAKNLSLLFGNFEVLTVEPFDIKISSEYLIGQLQHVNLNDGFRNFITHFSGGYPVYLKLISEALLKQNSALIRGCCMDESSKRVSPLVDALEDLLFCSSGILNQRFSSYLKRIEDDPLGKLSSILYLVAEGRNRIKDIAHALKIQRKDLILRINRLLEFNIMTRSEDFIKINDRVFGFWLRFVHQGKLRSLSYDARSQKEQFRKNIEGQIQEFLLSSQKPLLERAIELLRLFEDETMQIEKRKIRLNHFREIKPLEFHTSRLKDGLIGRSCDCLWVMAFKQELLVEEDIADFAKECKKYRHKLQRKIIVTLEGMDANTRLKALEEKIWAWDVNNLNQILDLYSKPWVVA